MSRTDIKVITTLMISLQEQSKTIISRVLLESVWVTENLHNGKADDVIANIRNSLYLWVFQNLCFSQVINQGTVLSCLPTRNLVEP